ncbi:MAG TPA: TauD/TfdA family dioxygenase [Stellaceae bacterium]
MSEKSLPIEENPTIRPVSDVLGAEVIGFDFARPMTATRFAAVRDALLTYQFLVFRDAEISEVEHIAFSEPFGELQVHVLNQYVSRQDSRLFTLTNLDDDGKPRGEHPDPGSAIWHTDGSWSRRRGVVTTLYGLRLPKSGGDTFFANMYAAYDALSPEMKQRLEGLRAVHNLDYSRRLTGAKQQMTEEQKRAAPPVEHPIIRVHPETGRKAIYLGEHASHIAGKPLKEGRELVKQINAHATEPRFIYRHRWRLHDFLLWDNRCLIHSATDFDWMNDVRLMRRTTVIESVTASPA